MTLIKKKTLVSLLLLIVMSGCYSSKKAVIATTNESSTNELTNTRWELNTASNKSYTLSERYAKAFIILNSDNKTITAYSGCNLYFGIYSVDANSNKLSFTRISNSYRDCNDHNLYEETLLQKLESTSHYTITDNILTLKGENGEEIQFVKGVNYENPIIEKHWVLKNINNAPAKMTQDQEQEMFFRLKSDDQSLIGFSGCNNFRGKYILGESNKIQFEGISSTKMACRNINEGEIFKMFEEADNYVIADDLLLLNAKDNQPIAEFEALYIN